MHSLCDRVIFQFVLHLNKKDKMLNFARLQWANNILKYRIVLHCEFDNLCTRMFIQVYKLGIHDLGYNWSLILFIQLNFYLTSLKPWFRSEITLEDISKHWIRISTYWFFRSTFKVHYFLRQPIYILFSLLIITVLTNTYILQHFLNMY